MDTRTLFLSSHGGWEGNLVAFLRFITFFTGGDMNWLRLLECMMIYDNGVGRFLCLMAGDVRSKEVGEGVFFFIFLSC